MPSTTDFSVPETHVAYQLLIALNRQQMLCLRSGRCVLLEAGMYVYSGSAKRALSARLRRHCRQEKRLFWNIDYLLAAPAAQLQAYRTSELSECQLHALLSGEVVLHFGAADCASCLGHLRKISAAVFQPADWPSMFETATGPQLSLWRAVA